MSEKIVQALVDAIHKLESVGRVSDTLYAYMTPDYLKILIDAYPNMISPALPGYRTACICGKKVVLIVSGNIGSNSIILSIQEYNDEPSAQRFR